MLCRLEYLHTFVPAIGGTAVGSEVVATGSKANSGGTSSTPPDRAGSAEVSPGCLSDSQPACPPQAASNRLADKFVSSSSSGMSSNSKLASRLAAA